MNINPGAKGLKGRRQKGRLAGSFKEYKMGPMLGTLLPVLHDVVESMKTRGTPCFDAKKGFGTCNYKR